MLDPNGFNELAQCRSGPLLYNKNDWPIGASLRKYGEFSWQEVEVFRQVVTKDMLVIDVGANIGTHTVELSKMAGFVLAFEPQRISFQTLCANLALNHCTNVRAFNAALGRENGHILVPSRDPTKLNNFGGVPLAGVTEGEAVELMQLDRVQLNTCGFIKADIEGMEAEFLEGARETIAKHRPILYLEADGAQKAEAIRTLFDWKYDCYWDLPRLYNPGNFRRDPENLFIIEGSELLSVNVLCVPCERNVRVDLHKVRSPEDDGMQLENERIKKRQKEAVLV